ncbi:DUF881 domain-containing protein [Clostridium ihumii]|uniref:DUF881 domain-containing protein n=1 Tax=Clostridium ihumii TaxID=1470356 RepID=UPI00058CB45E|nr:DUF881 domain-containing protein [Clostridium ihumii]
MKKITNQLIVGSICMVLAFLITVQIKTVNKRNVVNDQSQNNGEILVENEHLKKQKEDLQKQVDALTQKSKEFEEAAAGKSEESTLILEELQQSRLQTGSVDVSGEGIIIYINPKSNMFNNNIEAMPVNDIELLGIVNELNAADAEAISINDIRLTARSGIRNAGSKSIVINNERISPTSRIVIKAIGSKKLLEQAINFPGAIPSTLQKICDINYELKDEVLIKKNSTNQKFDYLEEAE